MLKNYFKMKENNTNIRTEFLAGLSTFLAMAYILGVNPTMLADGGMPLASVFLATALSSGIACILMGLFSNYPIVTLKVLYINYINVKLVYFALFILIVSNKKNKFLITLSKKKKAK